jgi:molybdate transport system ATP-binding protein
MNGGLDARLVLQRGSFSLDVELAIPPGHTIALLGPNAAGKSTAVAALTGLLRLGGGHIRLGTRTLDDPASSTFVAADERNIGVVFQDGLLFPHLSALDNISFGLRSRGVNKRAARTAAAGWLDRVGGADIANRRPGDLSGGQAQRVALARALATDPEMILLDEPFSSLDVTDRARLRHLLDDHLADFGGPRLLITHDPAEAFLLADQIWVIENGVITQSGTPDDIRLRPRTRYVADLAGSNLMVGTAAKGTVTAGGHEITIADLKVAGPVLATIHPRAISLHRNQPEGSPRNSWPTEVLRVEHYGDRVRLQTGSPLPLTAEITPQALDSLGLEEGSSVWLSIKATEIEVAAG